MSDPADQLTDELADKIREIVALIDKYAVECEVHQIPASKVLMDSRRRWKEILADYDG